MSEDSRVKKRSNQEIRDIAQRRKASYKVDNSWPVNIIRCLQSGWVPTEQGRKKVIYRPLPDRDMGGDDGRTDYDADTVTISVKRSVHEMAEMGVGRARMTLAHELAHAVMHYGTPKFRRAGAAGPTDIAIINASESAEHQAKVFASAFLIHDEAAAKLSGPEQISTEFLVSLEAAEICFERLTERAERIRAAERVEKATLAFKEEVRTEAHAISYLKDLCTRCGKAMLVPIGIKFLCMNCDFVSDQFQDGDRND